MVFLAKAPSNLAKISSIMLFSIIGNLSTINGILYSING